MIIHCFPGIPRYGQIYEGIDVSQETSSLHRMPVKRIESSHDNFAMLRNKRMADREVMDVRYC